jgi:hypothetical protein
MKCNNIKDVAFMIIRPIGIKNVKVKRISQREKVKKTVFGKTQKEIHKEINTVINKNKERRNRQNNR